MAFDGSVDSQDSGTEVLCISRPTAEVIEICGCFHWLLRKNHQVRGAASLFPFASFAGAYGIETARYTACRLPQAA